jgi:hypothetical protein
MRYSQSSVIKAPRPDAEILDGQARELERLIKETQRIQEVKEHLSKLRHAGDRSAPNKKS